MGNWDPLSDYWFYFFMIILAPWGYQFFKTISSLDIILINKLSNQETLNDRKKDLSIIYIGFRTNEGII